MPPSATAVVVHPVDEELGRLGSGAGEGGLTPLLLVREAAKGRRLFPVPDRMPLEVAALAEPTGVSMQAVNQAEVQPGDTVAVFGCGPIGLLAIATLADRGITDVVAVDLSPRRLELAGEFGAAHLLNPSRRRRVVRAGPAARHHALHVRTHAGDRRLHRGVGLGPRHRRHPRARARRWPHVAGRRALPAGADQLRRTSS